MIWKGLKQQNLKKLEKEQQTQSYQKEGNNQDQSRSKWNRGKKDNRKDEWNWVGFLKNKQNWQIFKKRDDSNKVISETGTLQ